jgi:hypothetical protein
VASEQARSVGGMRDPVRSGDMHTDKVESIVVSPSPRIKPQPISASARNADADVPADEAAASDARSAVRAARRRLVEQRAEEQKREQQSRIERAGTMLAGEAGVVPEPGPTAPQPTLDRPGGPSPTTRATPVSMVPDPPVARPGRSVEVQRRIGASQAATVEPSVDFPAKPPAFGRSVPPRTTPERAKPPQPARSRDVAPVHIDSRTGGDRARSQSRRNVEQRTEPLPNPVGTDGQHQLGRSAAPPALEVSLRQVRRPSPRRDMVVPLASPSRSVVAGDATEGPRKAGVPALPLALKIDPLDEAPLAASLPRTCGTCREFKREGDSAHGWCSQEHALVERRMVESSELACRSTLGVWWLPLDDLRLERADTAHHGRPTPLLDYEVRAGTISRLGKGSRSR